MQQLSEGFVWNSLEQNNIDLGQRFDAIYLFFAFCLWPFWIPFSLFFIEKKRKFLFSILTIYGALLGIAIFFLCLSRIDSLSAVVVQNSLCYSCGYSVSFLIGFLLYSTATIVSSICSSYFRIKILGVTFALFAAISYLMNTLAFISVWCFFSAILSIAIVWIVHKETELSI